MAALSERKLEIVRTLVESAPDTVVDSLYRALADAAGGAAIAGVLDIVETEARDRQLRNVVLGPLAPMCVGDGATPHRLSFPVRAAGLIWRGLKAQAPAVVRNAELALHTYQPGDGSADQFDRLLRIAAKGVRGAEVKEFRVVREVCDQARPGGGDALLTCLEVAPVVRAVTSKLPAWTKHPNRETTAAARLAYKDAVAASALGGPSFFHMLAAQLSSPCLVLRIISAVMDKPTDRYLSDSELGVFGEAVLHDIDQALARASALQPDGGVEAAVAAARDVAAVATAANELEANLTLSREQGWGKRLMERRAALAAMVETRCSETQKAFDLALPSGRGGGKRGRARVSALPDPTAVGRCRTLLSFVSELSSSANHGGFAAARTSLLETLGEHLDPYIEELLETLKGGEAKPAAAASAYLEVAAEFSGLVRDAKAAELVRRRAAAAAAPPAVDPVQSLLTGT